MINTSVWLATFGISLQKQSDRGRKQTWQRVGESGSTKDSFGFSDWVAIGKRLERGSDEMSDCE
nr:hypothetical protein [Rhodopirellula islandica]